MTNDAKARKGRPLCTGVLDYFPDALLAVAEVSRIGNDQHNPGEPLHWAKEKSTDEADSLMRHLADRGKLDTDGTRHSAKVAWRALALLQREIDADRALGLTPILSVSALPKIKVHEYGLTIPYAGVTVGDPPAHPVDHTWGLGWDDIAEAGGED